MRPRIGAALVAAALVSALCCASAVQAGAAGATVRAHATASARSSVCPGANLLPSRTNTATIDTATLCLIDHLRTAHHLHPLRANDQLQGVAISQVKDMVRLDYFADDRPSGQTPANLIAATPYGQHSKSLSIGENIGWGTGADATPGQMVSGWMQSPPHREIILTGEYTDAGIGVTPAVPSAFAEGQHGATYALELAKP
jgi:uncharacterized protein YkwD